MDLETELFDAPAEVRGYLQKEFGRLLRGKGLSEAVSGHLDSRIAEERAQMLLDVLRRFVVR